MKILNGYHAYNIVTHNFPTNSILHLSERNLIEIKVGHAVAQFLRHKILWLSVAHVLHTRHACFQISLISGRKWLAKFSCLLANDGLPVHSTV